MTVTVAFVADCDSHRFEGDHFYQSTYLLESVGQMDCGEKVCVYLDLIVCKSTQQVLEWLTGKQGCFHTFLCSILFYLTPAYGQLSEPGIIRQFSAGPLDFGQQLFDTRHKNCWWYLLLEWFCDALNVDS